MDWRKHYQNRMLSAEDAAKIVKSGDYVRFASREPASVGLAIAARKEELKNVKVYVQAPGVDFGWYDPGWEESFVVTIGWPTSLSQQMLDERRSDFRIFGNFPHFDEPDEERQADILLVEISTPDERGFCSFGNSVWNKKRLIRESKLVIGEVNDKLIRTYGDNFVHVSEIDYFVKHISTGAAPGAGSLAGRALKQPEPYIKRIIDNVSELVRDGDTLQIGVGRATEQLATLGAFDGKHDLGFHSEATPPGIISLVQKGVITGKYKTLNPGKVVVTSLGGGNKEEMEWANSNPLFYLVDAEYLEDVRVIAAHDNMVAINQGLIIDLTGQIGAETIGSQFVSAAGGQIAFVIGAQISKGGRSITVLPSTAREGSVSRIVPRLPEGTVVTIQRSCADYIVTEYGIAHIRGKTIKQRVQELINIAHPDFRTELQKEAKRLFWP